MHTKRLAERAELIHPPEALHSDRVGRVRTILGRTLARLGEHVRSWHRGRRSRRLLARLDDRMLRDIGIDRATAERDSTTSFWRLR